MKDPRVDRAKLPNKEDIEKNRINAADGDPNLHLHVSAMINDGEAWETLCLLMQ